MKPLVSIIIPAFNGELWLADTIRSCTNQTWENVEIIVVDNGSSDGTLRIAHNFECSLVHVYQCPRRGANAARNFGLGASKGDFIQFLDADDILGPEKIARQIDRLATFENCVASGPWVRFSNQITGLAAKPERVWRDFSPSDFLVESWSGGGMMPPFCWLSPRHAIEKAGLWDEGLTLNQDGEYFTRVLLASSGIVFCPDAMGYYRTGTYPSISKNRTRRGQESGLRSIDLSTHELRAKRDDPTVRKACAYQYKRFCYSAYPQYPDLAEIAERRATELGGCDLTCPGGPIFQLVSAAVGWRAAKRLQTFARAVPSS